MAEAGNPYENAVAERVNGILKDEFGIDSTGARDLKDLENMVSQSIWLYNERRSHASCDYLTPNMAHSRTGILRKRW